ncbi:hypothetical protein Pelo_14364 [Pelomyxa schiedti]|nr:hypothetical protein Pelo_14364 [Pelomyxa schiedti]
MMVVCFFNSFLAGVYFATPAYLPSLKYDLGWTNAATNAVLAMGIMGIGLGIIPGIMYDKLGPVIVCVYSGITSAIAYFSQFAQVEGGLSSPGLFAFLSLFKGQCTIALSQASIQTTVQIAPPKWRGGLLGLLTALFNLSGAFFSILYAIFFIGSEPSITSTSDLLLSSQSSSSAESYTESKVAGFLLMAGILMVLGAVLGAVFLRRVRRIQRAQAKESIKDTLKAGWIFLPWIATTLFSGSTQAIVGNAALIAHSNGMSQSEGQAIVILSLIMSFLGRLSVGFLSDFLRSRPQTKRIFNRMAFSFIISVTCWILLWLLFSLDNQAAVVWPACLLINFCYGGNSIMSGTFLSEAFGLANFGLITGVQGLASCTWAFIVSMEYGLMYDKYADPTTLDCIGNNCYKYGFLFSAVNVTFSVCMYFTLWLREFRLNRSATITSPTTTTPTQQVQQQPQAEPIHITEETPDQEEHAKHSPELPPPDESAKAAEKLLFYSQKSARQVNVAVVKLFESYHGEHPHDS